MNQIGHTLHKTFVFGILLFIITACGYKPSSHAIKKVFDESIYVDVVVDRAEPENAPYIKDEINRIVYKRFKGKVTSDPHAKSRLRISYNGSTFRPLSYDSDGYITRYRALIKVKFDMVTKQGKMSKRIVAVHESDIQESSLHSSALRTEAITIGVSKALDEFLAYVSAKGTLSAER
jgi:hypothetical protein